MPGPLANALPDGNRMLLGALERILEWRRRDPIKGWAIRRGLLVHGVETPLDYLKALSAYTLEGRLDHIRCPAFIASAEADEIGVTTKRLYDGIRTPKVFQKFRVEEGAGAHSELGRVRSLIKELSIGWRRYSAKRQNSFLMPASQNPSNGARGRNGITNMGVACDSRLRRARHGGVYV